jgi:IclR family transcriptional regulator, KDG regulon repressor
VARDDTVALSESDDQVRLIQSVDRAIRLLKLLSEHNGEMTITSLASQLGVHKSTTSRIITSLEHHGLVRKNRLTERYELGIEVVVLGGVFLQHSEIIRIADPHLRELAELTQETVNLMVRYDDNVVSLEQIPGKKVVRPFDWLGKRIPLHLGSGARSLLAHLHSDEIDNYLVRLGEQDSTVNTSTLRTELAEIRSRGFEVNRGTIDTNVYALGAPILDQRGRARAAISVAGFKSDFTDERIRELIPVVRRSAEMISRQLGFEHPWLAQVG